MTNIDMFYLYKLYWNNLCIGQNFYKIGQNFALFWRAEILKNPINSTAWRLITKAGGGDPDIYIVCLRKKWDQNLSQQLLLVESEGWAKISLFFSFWCTFPCLVVFHHREYGTVTSGKLNLSWNMCITHHIRIQCLPLPLWTWWLNTVHYTFYNN